MKLFVYGTLLSPFYTASLIPETSLRQPAATIGRMYHYVRGGYPAISIPNNLIHAAGSLQYLEDEAVEQSQANLSWEDFRKLYADVYTHGFDWIYGELVEFEKPDEVMPALDRYEGFRLDDPLYHRSLVPVKVDKGIVWAWVYHFLEDYPFEEEPEKDRFIRVPEGDWVAFLGNF